MGYHTPPVQATAAVKRGSRSTRRRFLGTTLAAGVTGLVALAAPTLTLGGLVSAGGAGVALADGPERVSAEDALRQLLAGNARYVGQQPEHPAQTAERRTLVAKGQHPVAVILGCADSRVPPEILFDQGLGDLFTIRVAGNIADDAVIGSIEYALEHLHVPLVIVLGHERCGAVQAALELSEQGGAAPGHLGALLTPIAPAVAQAKLKGGDVLDAAVIANVSNVTAQLKAVQPVIAELVHEGEAKIVGARYDLDTGTVTIVA